MVKILTSLPIYHFRLAKVALIRETDVTERDVLDKFSLLAHRQAILLKHMSRLEHTVKVTAAAAKQIETAPVADAAGSAPHDDEQPFGGARPQLAPGERLTDALTDAHNAAPGQQRALEQSPRHTLDLTLDPPSGRLHGRPPSGRLDALARHARPDASAEDVERGRTKATGERLAKASAPSVDPDDATRPNEHDIVAATRALAARALTAASDGGGSGEPAGEEGEGEGEGEGGGGSGGLDDDDAPAG